MSTKNCFFYLAKVLNVPMDKLLGVLHPLHPTLAMHLLVVKVFIKEAHLYCVSNNSSWSELKIIVTICFHLILP